MHLIMQHSNDPVFKYHLAKGIVHFQDSTILFQESSLIWNVQNCTRELAVTLTLLQSQTAFSERPFLTFGFVEAFCFVFLFVCFFQNDQGSSEHPAREAALPWGCVGSSDEDSVHSPLVALLLQANITSADPC